DGLVVDRVVRRGPELLAISHCSRPEERGMNALALTRRGLVYALLSIAAFVSVFPFYWMVVGATNKSADIVIGKPTPGLNLFANVATFFATVDVPRVFWNSAYIAL